MWTQENLKLALNLKDTLTVGEGSGVSIDTRTVAPGNIYIALKGPNHDGHSFVEEALHKGAAAAIVERVQEGAPASKQICVENTQKALEMLAKFARAHTQAIVIGLTGSQGKTTVKEFLAHVFSKFGDTVAAKGSYNNHIGTPLSLAHLTPQTRYGVFEMGMDNPGEIAPLSRQVSPHIAIITTIGEAHIGRMGSSEEIAKEKGEIFSSLDPKGTAIIPFNNPHYERLKRKVDSYGIRHVYTFGSSKDTTARLISFVPHDTGTGSNIVAEIEGQSYAYTINLPGEHNVFNSLIVLLTAKAAGLAIQDILPHMATFNPVKGRGQRHHVHFKDGTITLIDDAYNANPSSMRAGLSVLAATKPDNGGRRIAVLGFMVDMGEQSPEFHRALAHVVDSCHVDLVFASGTEMSHLYEALPEGKRGGYVTKAEEIIPLVMDAVTPNDVVFVKGSKVSHISKVVDAFLKQ